MWIQWSFLGIHINDHLIMLLLLTSWYLGILVYWWSNDIIIRRSHSFIQLIHLIYSNSLWRLCLIKFSDALLSILDQPENFSSITSVFFRPMTLCYQQNHHSSNQFSESQKLCFTLEFFINQKFSTTTINQWSSNTTNKSNKHLLLSDNNNNKQQTSYLMMKNMWSLTWMYD